MRGARRQGLQVRQAHRRPALTPAQRGSWKERRRARGWRPRRCEEGCRRALAATATLPWPPGRERGAPETAPGQARRSLHPSCAGRAPCARARSGAPTRPAARRTATRSSAAAALCPGKQAPHAAARAATRLSAAVARQVFWQLRLALGKHSRWAARCGAATPAAGMCRAPGCSAAVD